MVEISEPGSAQAGSRKRLHSQANMEEKKETDGEEGEESPGETRSPPEKQKSRARQLWRTLQKDFRHAVEKMKTEEMKVAYLSHGLQHLSHLVLDSPVRYVTHDPSRGLFMALDSEDKLHFLREDGSYKGSVRAPFPMMGLLYATEVDQFVAWDAGGLQVLNARLQPLSQASSPCPIRCGLYCQELNRIVTAGERNLTLWDFRYGHRSLHCRLSVDLGSEDTITHLALDATSSKAQRCFVSYGTGVAAFDISKGMLLSSKRNLHSRVITDITYCDVTGCIVTASRDTTIKVWDDNWHIQTVFVGHTAPVIAVTFYPERPFIFSASQDGTIRTWNLSTTDQVDQVHTSEPVETLETLSISRVASCSGRLLNLWKINQLYSLYTPLGSPLRRLACVNLEAVGNFPIRAVCICQDCSVRLVDVQSGLILSSFVLDRSLRPKEAAYCLPRETLFVLTEQGSLLRINTATDPMVVRKNISNQEPRSRPCCLLLYSHIVDPGKVLATWLQVKEDKTYRKQWQKQPLMLQDKNRFLPIMGHKDGLLSVMEWFSGRIQCQVKAHSPRAVTALAEYPTQMCVISAGNDRTVKMWRLFPYADECLVPLLSFSCAAPATHMCSLGPTLAMAFQDPQTVTHRVVYYNLMEQSRSEHGPEEDAEDDITGLCCCPNLRLFASSSRDGSVKIWNMKNQMLRHLKLNTIPEALAFANHWGDLLVGIERHLYLIHHSKYLPNYYKMKVLCAKFLEPLQDACLPLSETRFQALVQENTRRLLHEPPLEESESPLPGAHGPVPVQEVKVTIEMPARRLESFQVALRDRDLERLQSGRASPAKKVRVTKEMKDEAFEQYLKIFYKEPFKVEIPEKDTFNADEVLEAMRYVTSISDLYGPGKMFLGCFPRPEILKTADQISTETPSVVPETPGGKLSLVPRVLKEEKPRAPSQAAPSQATPSPGAPSRVASSPGTPQTLLSTTTTSGTESISEAEEAQAKKQVDVMMKEMFYREKSLLPPIQDPLMKSPQLFQSRKQATLVDPKAVAQGLLLTTKDSKEGMTKPLREKYESQLDVIVEPRPKPVVPPMPPEPPVPLIPPVSAPLAAPVPRTPSMKSGKIIVFKEPSSIAFKEQQATAMVSREQQRSFSPGGSSSSPQRSSTGSPSRLKSHSSEIIKGFFPERQVSSPQWKDMPPPVKSHHSVPLPRIGSGFVPNSVVSQQLRSLEELEFMRRKAEEDEEEEERIMEITGPTEESRLDRSFFWSPPQDTSPPPEPAKSPARPRTPKSPSFKATASAVFMTQLRESLYKDKRKEPPFFVLPFLEHDWFKALFPEGFPPDMTVNEFLTVLLGSLVSVDFGTKSAIVGAIARLKETLQDQMKDVVYKTVLYVMNKGEEDPAMMDRNERKFILSALRMLLHLDKDKEELMTELMTYYVISPPSFRVAMKDLIQDVGVQDPHNYFFKEMDTWPVQEGDTRESVRRRSSLWLTARMQELRDHRTLLLEEEGLLEGESFSGISQEDIRRRSSKEKEDEEEEEEEEEESDGVVDQVEEPETEEEASETYAEEEMDLEKQLDGGVRLGQEEGLEEASRVLDECLAAVSIWMRRNKLKINPDKTEVLLVDRNPDRGIGWQPVLDGVTLPLKPQVRSLGVLLDSSLTLEAQASAVSGRAFAQLRLVRQLRPYLAKADLAGVVHALVTSRLDYCNALYVGLPLKTARKFQLVQRAAARMLTGAPYRERSTLLFKELHWLPFTFRAQFKVQVLTYKALNGLGPSYLRDRISVYEPTRSLRSSGEALLVIPPASQARLVGTRDRAFSVVAPRLWNTLPKDLRQAPTLAVFRKNLKTWLFQCAFPD